MSKKTNEYGLEIDDAGNIIVCRLTGYTAFLAGGMIPCLRLEFECPPGESGTGDAGTLQVRMTASQARSLAEAVLRKVDAASSVESDIQN